MKKIEEEKGLGYCTALSNMIGQPLRNCLHNSSGVMITIKVARMSRTRVYSDFQCSCNVRGTALVNLPIKLLPCVT